MAAHDKKYRYRRPKDTGIFSWYAQQIVKVLEDTRSGWRVTEVFRDWLAVVEMTLKQLPAQAEHVAAHGTLPPAPDEEQQLFRRLVARYDQRWPRTQELFGEAFGLLQEAVVVETNSNGLWQRDKPGLTYRDVLGDIYMVINRTD